MITLYYFARRSRFIYPREGEVEKEGGGGIFVTPAAGYSGKIAFLTLVMFFPFRLFSPFAFHCSNTPSRLLFLHPRALLLEAAGNSTK